MNEHEQDHIEKTLADCHAACAEILANDTFKAEIKAAIIDAQKAADVEIPKAQNDLERLLRDQRAAVESVLENAEDNPAGSRKAGAGD